MSNSKKGFSKLIGEPKVQFSYTNEYGKVDEREFFDVYDTKIEDFIFLAGFPKTATSTIASLFYLHENICLPLRKEPFYFTTDEFDYGMGYYWKKYYGNYEGQTVLLDANTAVSWIPYASKRIAEKLPNAKIVFSLRNPIDRAYSNWRMYRNSGEENLSFREAVEWEMNELEKNLIPFQSEDDDYWKWHMRRLVTRDFYIRRRTVRTYLTRGYYALHLKRFLKYFDREQIYIVYQENLKRDKESTFTELLETLGISPNRMSREISQTGDYHVGYYRTSRLSRRFINLANKAGRIKEYIPSSFRKTGLAIVRSIENTLEMDDDLREELVAFYQDKNMELEKLLDADLSHWNV